MPKRINTARRGGSIGIYRQRQLYRNSGRPARWPAEESRRDGCSVTARSSMSDKTPDNSLRESACSAKQKHTILAAQAPQPDPDKLGQPHLWRVVEPDQTQRDGLFP